MGTRSRIGLKIDGGIVSAYHHWDGYPEWLGVTLEKKFNTRETVEELIDGGDISCCDSDTNWDREKCEPHVQYYNDRGEKTEPRLDLSLEDYLEPKDGEEYAYIFSDNQWVCYELPYQGTPELKEIPEEYPVK